MKNFVLFLSLALASHTSTGLQAEFSTLIRDKSIKYNIDYDVLKTIIKIESSFNPWAFNVHGESFMPDSKARSIQMLDMINRNPWLVKIRTSGNSYKRYFFPQKSNSIAFFRALNRSANGNFRIKCLESPCALIQRGDSLIRKLRVESTDFGLGQVNYRWHGKKMKKKTHWSTWFDPDFNVDYSAKHIAELSKRFSSAAEIVANYHSGDQELQNKYLERFNKAWPNEPLSLEREREGVTLASE